MALADEHVIQLSVEVAEHAVDVAQHVVLFGMALLVGHGMATGISVKEEGDYGLWVGVFGQVVRSSISYSRIMICDANGTFKSR